MALNLKNPKALRCSTAWPEGDVIVENFRPDVKAKLGIDYESIRKINPRIVYGSISGFGQDGPYHKRPGFDQIAQGMGGLMSITGAPGEGPMRVGIPVADLSAGLFCAMGILTALLEREVSGEGQWVQTSLLQAQIFMLDFQAARWLMDKDVAQQAGNDHPTSIPTGVFKTSDGYINIATTGGRIWHRFAETLGAPDLPNRPEYATAPDRSKNRKQLNAEISRLTEKKSSEAWVKAFNAAGVPAARSIRSTRYFPTPKCSTSAWRGMSPTPRAGDSPGRPALHAVAHAKPNGGPSTGIRRADRRSAGGVWVYHGGDRSAEAGQGRMIYRQSLT